MHIFHKGDVMRGSGRTTRQMNEAPENAWYVIRDMRMFTYVRQLMKTLERQDLQVQTPEQIRPDKLMGFEGEIIIDHAAYINGEQFHAIMQWDRQKRLRK
jgi:hypothetical protein